MYTNRLRIQLRSKKALYIPPAFSTFQISEPDVRDATRYCSNLLKYYPLSSLNPSYPTKILDRKYDSPSYTLQTFIPRTARPTYLAVRALNIELARIADTVSSPAIGALRFQFWRDNITHAFAQRAPPAHPVPILLAHALATLPPTAHLSKPWLLRLVSAREQYQSNPPYVDLAALESYAESTYSTLLYLILSAIPLNSLSADHLASHIGKASGIAAVLRGIPLIAFPHPPNHHSNRSGLALDDAQRTSTRQGAVMLPLDVMAEAGVREEDVLRLGPEAHGLKDAVFAVATRASDHLITARQMLRNLRSGESAGHAYEHEGEDGHTYSPSHSLRETAAAESAEAAGGDHHAASRREEAELESAFGVLMPAVATGLWLERLEKVDFDIFRPELRMREWRLPWRAYWAWRRKLF